SLRTPSRDSMLASAASAVGVGRGFAIHEVIDQIGAVLGPLIVAWVLAVTANDYAPALGILAVPGVLALGVLMVLRRRVPHPEAYESAEPNSRQLRVSLRRSGPFWWYMLFTLVTCSAIATFGVMSFRMVSSGVVSDATVPVLYALAMGIDAVAAMLAGLAYDRFHLRSLYVLPLIAVVIPFVAYQRAVVPVIAGAVLWGAATGVQESTMRAVIADIAPLGSRASAYGYFAIALGLGALAGGSIAGWLSTVSIPALIGFTVGAQAVACCILVRLNGRTRIPSAH
ncbi:MAG: MFS transporter, partial [Microbacteriaceae bacterium]|nr:MFS transporter [Microbacteriaceae bacterium]